mmetsp:Transcript_10622/g.26612  ORF Transcript_10622/g.26612 Transcript_10622/m.26612 type:complete len:229 (+) Transcript_10622:626-1312(+)
MMLLLFCVVCPIVVQNEGLESLELLLATRTAREDRCSGISVLVVVDVVPVAFPRAEFAAVIPAASGESRADVAPPIARFGDPGGLRPAKGRKVLARHGASRRGAIPGRGRRGKRGQNLSLPHSRRRPPETLECLDLKHVPLLRLAQRHVDHHLRHARPFRPPADQPVHRGSEFACDIPRLVHKFLSTDILHAALLRAVSIEQRLALRAHERGELPDFGREGNALVARL